MLALRQQAQRVSFLPRTALVHSAIPHIGQPHDLMSAGRIAVCTTTPPQGMAYYYLLLTTTTYYYLDYSGGELTEAVGHACALGGSEHTDAECSCWLI